MNIKTTLSLVALLFAATSGFTQAEEQTNTKADVCYSAPMTYGTGERLLPTTAFNCSLIGNQTLVSVSELGFRVISVLEVEHQINQTNPLQPTSVIQLIIQKEKLD